MRTTYGKVRPGYEYLSDSDRKVHQFLNCLFLSSTACIWVTLLLLMTYLCLTGL